MQELLEIRLLGPFEVRAAGTPADVGGSKRQVLLAMLALRNGRPVEIDALVDGLWGEELPAAPRNALHHHIARLRAALGEGSIVGFPDGYAVKDAHVDAVRFEELLAETRAALRDGDVRAAADAVESALALWRGPALQGLTGTAWFGAEARRLEALRVDALEEQFELALALGEHRELTAALRATLADNPFRERLWGQLMLALYRSGRQADALETFQEARRVLADELGLEPGTRAAAAPGGDSRPRSGDRRRPGRPQAPRQSPRTFDVVRRPRRGASRGRSTSARAPHRDAHGPARRRQEPARGRDGTLARPRVPRRHLARRLRACGGDGRRGPAARERRRRPRLGSTRAPRVAASRRERAHRPRRVRARPRRGGTHRVDAPGGVRRGPDPRDEPRGAPRFRRGPRRRRAAALGGRRPVLRARASGAARIRAGRRGRRARGRDRPARGLPAARDRARRRTCARARARGARLHARAALGAPARQPCRRPRPHGAARARGLELRPLARGREDAAPAACRPPRRRVPHVTLRGRSDARTQRRDRRVPR